MHICQKSLAFKLRMGNDVDKLTKPIYGKLILQEVVIIVVILCDVLLIQSVTGAAGGRAAVKNTFELFTRLN
jgi:hypothetical protein